MCILCDVCVCIMCVCIMCDMCIVCDVCVYLCNRRQKKVGSKRKMDKKKGQSPNGHIPVPMCLLRGH